MLLSGSSSCERFKDNRAIVLNLSSTICLLYDLEQITSPSFSSLIFKIKVIMGPTSQYYLKIKQDTIFKVLRKYSINISVTIKYVRFNM